tara:strand:- start:8226 stop:8996 length:771 start_codon:yes stop_codon:yes gene_type:complete
MRQLWNWIKNNPNRAMFLLPILLVAGISISHVVSWYDMANPINWAIYLSIAIEVGAITALVAATNRIKGGIWFMFGIVTFIQMIGNIFYSFKEIDETGELFKSWIELTGPIWELMGTETTDLVGIKRWLAFLEGGLLPIISLTSLHFFVKYEKPEELVNHRVNDTEESMSKDLTKSTDIVDEQAELEKQINEEMSKISNKNMDNEIRMSKISDSEQPNLVEEEKPEDELILPLVDENKVIKTAEGSEYIKNPKFGE